MEFGLHLPASSPGFSPAGLVAFARRAEALGFDYVTVADHVVVPRRISVPYPYTLDGKYPGSGHHLEALATIGFLAGATERLRFVTSVMIAPYRSPVVTAKMLATLDVLSGGRIVAGIGAGWMKEEFEALGAPPYGERGRVTDEYIRAFRELWTAENPRFEGKYCSFSDIVFVPRPVQKPGIPIWIGGHSDKAIRRAAELGDGWHPIGGVPAVPLEPRDLERSVAALRTAARAAGRDPEQIRVAFKGSLFDREIESVPGRRRRFTGSAPEIASDVREYRAAGADVLILDVRRPGVAETLERMEWLRNEVLARL
ncbi:MAG TPA: LLM class F420-dependent oxidoreductase [candidate division Zixibacteria bacterium]|nr:LLM class F420-dependent oxidoreductase [candidate division Zixibacteria bacterium]